VPRRRRTTRAARLAAATAAAVAVAALAACSGGGTDAHAPTPTPTPSPSVDGFLKVNPLGCLPAGAQAARLGDDGLVTVVAWSPGSGSKGVLLAPQSSGGACLMATEWKALTAQGYTVAAFDWGEDDETSMRTAAAKLHDLGVTQLALVGASKGGTYVESMARELGAVAVVALSPPATFGSADGVDTGYPGPITVYASQDDASVAPSDTRLTVPGHGAFTVVSGDAHGVALLQGPHQGEVQAAIDATLRAGFGG